MDIDKYFENVEEEISFCIAAPDSTICIDDQPSLILERDESMMCKVIQSGFNGDESTMCKINQSGFELPMNESLNALGEDIDISRCYDFDPVAKVMVDAIMIKVHCITKRR